MLSRIVKFLKKSDTYSIDKEISKIDLISIIFHRVCQVIRGLFVKPFLKKSSGLLFKGRNVKLRHSNKLKIGSNCILEDNVFINALSINGIILGNNVSLQRDCILICTGVIRNLGEGIKIGNNVGINTRAFLGGQGGIEIGDNVIIGPDVKIFSENHNFENINIPIKDQGETRKKVVIGDDCWIGAGSIILAGVTLGNGTVVAAGSVVNNSLPEYSVIGGVPAKILKSRIK